MTEPRDTEPPGGRASTAEASATVSAAHRAPPAGDVAPEFERDTTAEEDPFAGAGTQPGSRSRAGKMWAARLVVYPPHSPARVVLLDAALTVERAWFAEVVAEDARMSRKHARLRQVRSVGTWEIVDEKSRNGTWVDGRRVHRHVLRQGAVIRVGDTVMVFEEGPHLERADDPTVSAAITHLEPQIAAAATDLRPVLLLGPTGAGKTYLAEQIAAASPVSKPFISVNCGALAPSLADAELFGHDSGAFTGAKAARNGLIEEADGGTLFLDEIGTISSEVQAKLLTCIESGRIRRVGATRERGVTVRYIAATNLDIERAVASGQFRDDLRYRLAGHVIHVRSLRDRGVDLVALATAFLGAEDHRAFTPDALEALLCFPWPGNIRELHHALSAARRRQRKRISLEDLPAPQRDHIGELQEEADSSDTGRPSAARLSDLLRDARGNVSEVSRLLGAHRTQVNRWCRYLGVDPADFR